MHTVFGEEDRAVGPGGGEQERDQRSVRVCIRGSAHCGWDTEAQEEVRRFFGGCLEEADANRFRGKGGKSPGLTTNWC